MRTENIQTLVSLKAGQRGVVTAFAGDYDSRNRLVSMGIAVGCEVKLLSKTPERYLVAVHEARLALGAQAAQHILVAVDEDIDSAFSLAVNRLKQIWGC